MGLPHYAMYPITVLDKVQMLANPYIHGMSTPFSNKVELHPTPSSFLHIRLTTEHYRHSNINSKCVVVSPPKGSALGDVLECTIDGKKVEYFKMRDKKMYFLPANYTGPENLEGKFKVSAEYDMVRFKMASETQHKRLRSMDVLTVDKGSVTCASKRIRLKLKGTMNGNEDYWQSPPPEYQTASMRAKMWWWQ